ncbi:MAG TPA: RagB/SusD family nutrient uptake outer membrane protein [Gemmatimonadaceae bacterium]|nr:RagB/SusD family nutrient uptake outer membrane protein [Gemmatimonadaceae bacterium]
MKIPIVIALAVVAAGCGSLTETSASQVLASSLFVPTNAATLANGVVGDFECAYADFATATGLVSDELTDVGLAQIGWDYDRRTVSSQSPIEDYACAAIGQNPGSETVPGVWAPLSTARFDGDTLLMVMNTWTNGQVPGRVQLIGQTAAYTAYALTLMGETMCAGAVDGGPRLTPDSLLGLADVHFGVAITNATAAGDAATLGMAYLGRARERLDRGHTADAKADAANVPAGFEWDATYDASSFRRENRLFTTTFRDHLYSIDVPFRGFITEGQADPRVSVGDSTRLVSADASTNIWVPEKDPTIGSPIAIAKSSEAQLIIAEADNDAGNSGAAITIINNLHAAAGLPAYSGANDQASVQAAIVHERAAELFMEGHRLGDMIRYGQNLIPFYPAVGAPFSKGGSYGTQLCFPLPVVENGT